MSRPIHVDGFSGGGVPLPVALHLVAVILPSCWGSTTRGTRLVMDRCDFLDGNASPTEESPPPGASGFAPLTARSSPKISARTRAEIFLG